MEPLTRDSSLYVKTVSGKEESSGLMGMLVDDGLLCGNEKFQNLTEATLQKFDSRPRQSDIVDFYGLKIESKLETGFRVLQPDHMT